MKPPGKAQRPANGSFFRRINNTRRLRLAPVTRTTSTVTLRQRVLVAVFVPGPSPFQPEQLPQRLQQRVAGRASVRLLGQGARSARAGTGSATAGTPPRCTRGPRRVSSAVELRRAAAPTIACRLASNSCVSRAITGPLRRRVQSSTNRCASCSTIASAGATCLQPVRQRLLADALQVVDVEQAGAVAVVDARVEVARHRDVEDHHRPARPPGQDRRRSARAVMIGSGAPVVLSTMSASASASSSSLPRHRLAAAAARPPPPPSPGCGWSPGCAAAAAAAGACSVSSPILPAPMTRIVLSSKWSNTWRT